MKQNTLLKPMLFGSLLIAAFAARAQAQDEVASLNLSTRRAVEIGNDAPDRAPKGIPFNTFHSIFPEATEVHWYTEDNGLTDVYFKTIGKTNRAFFNKKGEIEYSISYYHKEMLPFSLLKKVNDAYPGKTIFGVTEISDNNGTTYVLVLQGKTSWVDVSIKNDEIQGEEVWNRISP